MAYEPDNGPEHARAFTLGTTEPHAFCDVGDADWVFFHAMAGRPIASKHAPSRPALRQTRNDVAVAYHTHPHQEDHGAGPQSDRADAPTGGGQRQQDRTCPGRVTPYWHGGCRIAVHRTYHLGADDGRNNERHLSIAVG